MAEATANMSETNTGGPSRNLYKLCEGFDEAVSQHLAVSKYYESARRRRKSAFKGALGLYRKEETAKCQQISEKITTCLPRELRDMIYVDLLKDTTSGTNPFEVIVPHHRTFKEKITGHYRRYFRPALFCHTFRQEFAQAFYSSAIFYVRFLPDLHGLLHSDLSGTGFQPWTSIRRLCVVPMYPSQGSVGVSETKNNLKWLLRTGDNPGRTLYFNVPNGRDSNAHIIAVFGSIFSQLKRQGFTVIVRSSYEWGMPYETVV
ncbi:hypothetical protein K491DRAFT_719738 [Lophiostoma macrostomum CBS 122681]|uniref:Uncharacterized protein n=1 Tax=Lophiostoma macrostomum CBS 122681 TaxID=1314788 RepID=A0A6A6SWV1_9PLEO|nr:hypothetical protein K491DRAFT_719738 [Lophiostoma macrostomum CBS 122681]